MAEKELQMPNLAHWGRTSTVTLRNPIFYVPIPEPVTISEPACKWHDKTVGEYANFVFRGASYWPEGEEALIALHEKKQIQNLQDAAMKRVKCSLREWPMCPEGQIELRWWEGWSGAHVARWECSCGRAGGIK